MKIPTEIASYFDALNEKRVKQALRMLEGDFSYEAQYDLITDCFFNNDPMLFDVAIPWLKEALKEESCMEGILLLERKRLDRDQAADPLNHHIEKMRQNLSAKILREQALGMFDDFRSTMVAAKDFTAAQNHDNYYLKNLLRIVYEGHRLEQAEQGRFVRMEPKSTPLYQYYLAAGIDFLDNDSQYSKYNLYSITPEIELMIGLPCRIFDPRQPLQSFIEDTPEHVLKLFERLRGDGLIKQLALLTSPDSLIETDEQIFVSLGVQETQQPLTLQSVDQWRHQDLIRTVMHRSDSPINDTAVIPSVSTFRQLDSEDVTWCSITPTSMTFEEIAQVPELLDDCAVTRVIHLEYFIEGGQLFISHIDHEYIFYTHEEFDQRAENSMQKGSARKRLKTFKIDRSAIPVILDDGTLFVHTLIHAHFERPHLLMNFLVGVMLPGESRHQRGSDSAERTFPPLLTTN